MNFLVRHTPQPVLNKLAIFEARRLKRQARLSYWWSRNRESFLGGCLIVGGILLVIGLIVGGIWGWNTYQNNQAIEASKLHVYKSQEAAYCNHGVDDSNNPDSGWLPCTVLQSNNKDNTNYFVTYGTVQANISVRDMKRR